MKKTPTALSLLALAACEAAKSLPPAGRSIPLDPHSHAQPNRVQVTHVALDLALDFESRRARGTCTLKLDRRDPEAPLVLDSKGLDILGVRGGDGTVRAFELGPEHDDLGAPLSIRLAPADLEVRVAYATTDRAAAMQWLAPEQTSGGAKPFLYTQGQSVYTRTWIPLQDTPGVRVTYEARIHAPGGMTALMSAEQLGRKADGAFHFRLDRPIPSYLIALACGELEFSAVSPRCGVWAEPGVVDAARAELGDTEAMIRSAERLYGPYRWGRYDVLILPPAFPYGGMENPCLTFATPTILAGDRSLVSVVAHELAHSWSGNLVSNATWRDFWLNEGFTVFLEKRLMEEVYGEERARMEKVLARAELDKEMQGLDPRDQVLHVDLAGRHPEDASTGVPYEKGALFLRRLEQVFGREAFDRFLVRYFEAHAFRSITTEEFVAWLKGELLDRYPTLAPKVDLAAWIEGEGMPPDAPAYESEALARAETELEAWKAGRPAQELSTQGWVTGQWLRFLQALPRDLAPERMAELDLAFGFTRSGNSEIVCVWLLHAISSGYSAADARLEEFLMNVGRRKYLKPIYTELVRTPEGKERARALYARARPRYHAVAKGTIDKIVEWTP